MKYLDTVLQRWRFRAGTRYIGTNVRVIDVGAHRGELFQQLGPRLTYGFGVDPLIQTPVNGPNYMIRPGLFPQVRPAERGWDAITLFAVLEHIPRTSHAELADACYDLLREGGRVIITVPSAAVDYILGVLRFFRLIDGMSLEEHFGYQPSETSTIFNSPRYRLAHCGRFQLGLNNLFVFEKEGNPSPSHREHAMPSGFGVKENGCQ
jgi:SAM-dependent methyltransferase